MAPSLIQRFSKSLVLMFFVVWCETTHERGAPCKPRTRRAHVHELGGAPYSWTVKKNIYTTNSIRTRKFWAFFEIWPPQSYSYWELLRVPMGFVKYIIRWLIVLKEIFGFCLTWLPNILPYFQDSSATFGETKVNNLFVGLAPFEIVVDPFSDMHKMLRQHSTG